MSCWEKASYTADIWTRSDALLSLGIRIRERSRRERERSPRSFKSAVTRKVASSRILFDITFKFKKLSDVRYWQKLILAVLFHVLLNERESTADDGAYVTVELDGIHLLMIPIFLKLETTHSAMNLLRKHLAPF